MIVNIDKERPDFEAYVASWGNSEEYTFLVLQKNSRGDYTTTQIQGAWEGWQARAAIPPSAGVAAETALQFLADQAQELGMGYEVTLSDGELLQIGYPKISRRATDLRAQLAAPAQFASTCRQCHADRLKEPCRAEDWEPCGMVWVALPGEPAQ